MCIVGGKNMPKAKVKDILTYATENKFGVAAINTLNIETVKYVIEAAERERVPIIVQFYPGFSDYTDLKHLAFAACDMAEKASIPVGVHLDHSVTYEIAVGGIRDGFPSVMIDGSHLDYEENVAITKQVVEYAHPKNVTVEAELGVLAGTEDDVTSDVHKYTEPDQAVDFVNRTGVDSLAIAIGTSHGAFKFKGEAKLRFDILEEIQSKLPNYPIVLHGASAVDQDAVATCNKFGGDIAGAKGVPVEMLRKASEMAVCKINMDTDLRLAMTAAIRKFMAENPKEFDPRKYLGAGRDAIKDVVLGKIDTVLGSKDSL